MTEFPSSICTIFTGGVDTGERVHDERAHAETCDTLSDPSQRIPHLVDPTHLHRVRPSLHKLARDSVQGRHALVCMS